MEIMLVVAIISLLGALAIPNLVRARMRGQAAGCIGNLRQIEGAKQQWALESKALPNASPTAAQIQPYLGRSSAATLPVCPCDLSSTFSTSYRINDLLTPPQCIVTEHKLNE